MQDRTNSARSLQHQLDTLHAERDLLRKERDHAENRARTMLVCNDMVGWRDWSDEACRLCDKLADVSGRIADAYEAESAEIAATGCISNPHSGPNGEPYTVTATFGDGRIDTISFNTETEAMDARDAAYDMGAVHVRVLGLPTRLGLLPQAN